MVKFGYKAGPEQFPPMELLEFGITAEEVGFDTLEVSDHFQPWSEAGQACFAWTWLGALAVRTNTIEMGTGVTCPTLRYNPAVIAQAAATVSQMSRGRFFLGVGTGEALNEYAATGEWPEYDERREMLEESIALMRKLWSGQHTTHEGMYYETRKAKLYTMPRGDIPVIISTMVPDSATFAGECGDGFITVGGQDPATYRAIMENFERAARGAQKDPAHMPRMIELNVEYTNDTQKAIEYQKKYWAGTFVPALFDQKIYTPAMSAKNGAVVGADTIEKKVCISGKAQDHVTFIQQYIDLGFTHLYFHSAMPDQKEFLIAYGRDVLPAVRTAITDKQGAGAA